MISNFIDANKVINVLVVDDSEFIRRLIKEILLAGQQNIRVVGEACDGKEAVDKVSQLNPDVVVMNLVMPGYDGLWALQRIMNINPTPVIFFTSLIEIDSEIAEEAYKLGALDIVIKPQNFNSVLDVKQELIYKIIAASYISKKQLRDFLSAPSKSLKKERKEYPQADEVVVIGSSAGGVPSLKMILMKLPSNFKAGITVAQHITSQLLKSLVNSISSISSLNIKIAKKGDFVRNSTVLFSPIGNTLVFYRTSKGFISGFADVGLQLQPDINTMFMSAAINFKKVIAVILPGLDIGTPHSGVVEIKKRGGIIIVEDYPMGMPKTVKDLGLADYVLNSEEIPKLLSEIISK